MELNRKLLSSLALLTAIYCGALATRPAKASLTMEVLANQVMAEEMILDGDTFVPSGPPQKSYMPFSPTLKYPSHITLQAIIHVKNPTHETINLSKVSFDVHSYDPWTGRKHYVTTVIRHIPPKVQRILHIPPYGEIHSPATAASLRFHVPFTALFDESSLNATPFQSLASVMNVVDEDGSEPLTVMNFVTPLDSQRNLEFSLGNMDVQGIPVPAPLALAGPWMAYGFARSMRKRIALRMN
jgi:hypothetical protein